MNKPIIPEIRAILNKIGVHEVEELTKIVNAKFAELYTKFPQNTKYRDYRKLIGLVIYFTLKNMDIPIRENDLMEYTAITKKELFQFKYTLHKYSPECEELSRKYGISQLMRNISENFQWGNGFYYFSKILLNALWKDIRNAKDEVIAGLISTLTVKMYLKTGIPSDLIYEMLYIDEKSINTKFKFLKDKIGHDILRSYTQFVDFYSYCPICRSKICGNEVIHNIIFFSPEYRDFKKQLSEKMSVVNFLEELNKEADHYFGIPCSGCFNIVRNIEGSISEVHKIKKFIAIYRKCPVCGAQNHDSTLIKFYQNHKKRYLRDILIKYMNTKNLNETIEKCDIKLGIPCCNCFDTYIENG